MSIAQSSVSPVLPSGVMQPPIISLTREALRHDAGIDMHWSVGQARDRGHDSVRRDRLQTAGIMAVAAAAVAGILRPSLGWFQ